MSDGTLYPRELVEDVFIELFRRLDPPPFVGLASDPASARHCPNALADRLCAVGGFRRRKRQMKDLELLFIPRSRDVTDATDLFGSANRVNVTERLIEQLVSEHVIEPRLSAKGHKSWGPANKLARHVATGLPLDLFAVTHEMWANSLVCRTGPMESNIKIAEEALKRGWRWNTYGAGFSRGGPLIGESEERVVTSEREVFEFVGMQCLAPEDRR